MRRVSYLVYVDFKEIKYKLGTFRTYEAAFKNARSVANEFKIIEQLSTYKKIFDSSAPDSGKSIYNIKE